MKLTSYIFGFLAVFAFQGFANIGEFIPHDGQMDEHSDMSEPIQSFVSGLLKTPTTTYYESAQGYCCSRTTIPGSKKACIVDNETGCSNCGQMVNKGACPKSE
jgi:hypothetical protein